jgi:hypothetical protein
LHDSIPHLTGVAITVTPLIAWIPHKGEKSRN